MLPSESREINTLLFLSIVVVGAVVQTMTGFAMGLIVMAGVALFGIADIAFAAAIVGFISFVNAFVAMRLGRKHINWRLIAWMTAGLVPAMIVGLLLLNWLSNHYYDALKLILGFVVIGAGTSLMISPKPFAVASGRLVTSGVGFLGGIVSGLYSAGGAPIAYFMYRQPFPLDVIRFTLLAIFVVITGIRSIMIGVAGDLNEEILRTTLIAIPLVVVTTLLATKIVPHVPDRMVRRVVFVVLIASGFMLIIGSIS